MSGVEVVGGHPLAVLPLLVSAVQRYENCLPPFLQLKKLAADLEESHGQVFI